MRTLPNVPIEVTSKGKTTARVIEAKLGDGYTQRAGDGINNLAKDWEVQWPNITSTQATSLESFFESCGGYEAFLWTAPGKLAPEPWTCKSWSRDPDVGGLTTMSGSFKKENDQC